MHRTSLLAVPFSSLALLSVLSSVGCASADPDLRSEPIGTASQAVDLAAFPANQVAVARDGSTPSKATGAVFIPYLNASHKQTYVSSTKYGNLPVRGTCGVTFVSPHYAITSSHCFADANAWDPAHQSFTARTFDVTQANVDTFYLDSAMQGTYPNYTPVFGHTMDQPAGYTSTSFSCQVASRCAYPAAGASAYNCDGVTAPDVTMLRCAGRSASGAWLPIAIDSSTTGPVFMYWFHELFDTNGDPDMIAHYTDYSSANWHYLGAPTNAFLPLKAVPWTPTVPRGRVGAGGDNDVRTDLYGCHGTSGSGVLSQDSSGNFALLGPVHAGGSAWAGSFLCDDPNALTRGAPNGHGITYNSNASVNNLVSAKYGWALMFDRNGVFTP